MTDKNFNWINPDYAAVKIRRIRMLQRIRDDKSMVLLVAAKKHYKNNPVDFINDWLETYDPRKKIPFVPFLLFDRQAEFIQWVLDRYNCKEDGLTEKSRDMGVTWLCVAFAVWMFIFHPNTKVSFGSRKESMVDRIGDPDSILEKARMLLRALPKEFLPLGFDENKHATFMKFVNPENGSKITGESGDNIGRGGRSSIYFKDESAFYERPEKIDAALSQNSDVKIDVSTPNGGGNPFHQKRIGGKIPVFTFHWSEDPRKDNVWYQKQIDTLPAFIVAQEIDIDYNASLEGVVLPSKYVQAAVGLNIEPVGKKMACLDVADEEGKDTNALALGHGVVVKSVQEWNGIDTTITARKAWGIAKAYGADYFNYDSIGVGAGIRGEINSLKKADDTFKPVVTPVNTAPPPKTGMLISGKKNSEMFASLKSLIWWDLRLRLERTFEHVSGIKEHHPDDMISLPNDPKLIAELCQVTYSVNGAGRVVIDKKGNGTKSPNLADAVVMYFVRPKVFTVSKF